MSDELAKYLKENRYSSLEEWGEDSDYVRAGNEWFDEDGMPVDLYEQWDAAMELLRKDDMNPRMLYRNEFITGAQIESNDIINDTRSSFSSVLMVKVVSVHHDLHAGVTEVLFENGKTRYIALSQEIEILKFVRSLHDQAR